MLAVVLVAGFMDFLDAGIVALVTPAIQADLDASPAVLEWVIAGYVLAFALGLITGGRLGDLFGRKRVFLIGVAGFTVASVLCGAAVNAEMLLLARVLQGAMASIMVPQVLSIIQVSFPAENRGGPLAAYGAMAGVANVSGPVVAGLLVESDPGGLGWRTIFLINVPVGLAVLVLGAVLIRETRSEHPAGLDVLGTLLVTSAMLLLMFPLVEGEQLGWPSWVLVMLACSVPVFWIFGRHQAAKQRRGGFPLAAVGLFRRRAFVAGLVLHIALFAGVAGFWVVFAMYTQLGLGFSTLQTGLTSLPWPVAILIFSGIGVALVNKLGRHLLSLGVLLMGIGMVALLWAVTGSAAVTSLGLAPGLALCGIGMALVAPSLMDLVLSGTPTGDAGSASGLMSTALQVGSALGVALIGVVYFGSLPDHAREQAAIEAPRVRAELVLAGTPGPQADEVVDRFRGCFVARVAGSGAQPAECVPAADEPPQATRIVEDAAQRARPATYNAAFAAGLRYEIAMFAISFLLMFLLPRRLRQQRTTRPETAPAD
ncbi:MFS transporter [Saccharopolyspora indica]|nr:MFS transporter [Saccharopolyspora indica]